MGPIYRHGSRFQVRYYTGPHDRKSRKFAGPAAFSEANEFYDELKRDPRVIQLWFTRLDGQDWVWVVQPVHRLPDGTWTAEAKPAPMA